MQLTPTHDNQHSGEYYAAIDLGSNSFHMVVVHVLNGSVQIIGKIKQKVRLASGLDDKLSLDEQSMERGWSCLQTFSERLQDIPANNVKVVATATLRLATNAQTFIHKAEAILNHKISVISGEEEARQIYLGVAYTSANEGNTLVIDIGGASTEIIVGNDMQPIHLVSTDMGCVTFMERYFPAGKLTQANFDAASAKAYELLAEVEESFLCFDWQNCLGASGTPQAITEILNKRGTSDAIRLSYLYELRDECIAVGDVDALKIEGLAASRQAIFPSGLAILIALFERLHIRDMNISGGALREGLIYGMLDGRQDSDRRRQTLNQVARRYHIDIQHAQSVAKCVKSLYQQYKVQSSTSQFDSESTLQAAALLHEIGLHIEYKRHHLHGAYILNYIDLPGFTRLQKAAIRDLVASHRLKLDTGRFEQYHDDLHPALLDLVRLLRIAVVLCLRRHNKHVPEVELKVEGNKWALTFAPNWLATHPLIKAELVNETWLQHQQGWELICE